MRWALLLAVAARAAEPGYVDPARCRNCHAAIYDGYRQSGMARTSGAVGEVPQLEGFTHRLSRRSYRIERRDGANYMVRVETGGANRVEARIDFVIGSGARSRTYVHRAGVRLVELPVSWYAENGGSWAMSPGYDRVDHSDFRREVSEGCLFCHNSYPSEANRGLPSGIDCQRCHGPGEDHVRGRAPILNPARLSPERRMEVCLQCHLESASRTLPDTVRRFGRSTFSYRPTEPLAAYQLYFDFVRPPADDRITVNNAGYGLMRSACFRRSEGRLTCVTCHDPHRPAGAAEAYTQACRGCHASAHTAQTANCTGCHMPKRRTEDAVHVAMTDHFIRRRALPGAGLKSLAERHDRQTGAVRPLYPARLPPGPEDALYLAIAQVRSSADLNGDIKSLEAAIAAARPAAPEPFVALGEALRAAGRASRAVDAYRQALSRGGHEARIYMAMGELLMGLDRVAEAAGLVEAAQRADAQNVDLRNTLAVLYGHQQRFLEAARLLEETIPLNASEPLTWFNLAVCRQAMGDKGGAEVAYREAIRLQPDFARAREGLRSLAKP